MLQRALASHMPVKLKNRAWHSQRLHRRRERDQTGSHLVQGTTLRSSQALGVGLTREGSRVVSSPRLTSCCGRLPDVEKVGGFRSV